MGWFGRDQMGGRFLRGRLQAGKRRHQRPGAHQFGCTSSRSRIVTRPGSVRLRKSRMKSGATLAKEKATEQAADLAEQVYEEVSPEPEPGRSGAAARTDRRDHRSFLGSGTPDRIRQRHQDQPDCHVPDQTGGHRSLADLNNGDYVIKLNERQDSYLPN